MSRAYRVEVNVKGISQEALHELMAQRFGWEETHLWEYKGIVGFEAEGWLSGGQSEEEAHEQIYKALKELNPQALILTKWTYLEDLPHSEYGDDFDINTPLPAPEHAAPGAGHN